jgi:hypothetical protein
LGTGNAAFEDAEADGAASTLGATALELSAPGAEPELVPWHASGAVATVPTPTEMAQRTKKVRMAGVLSKLRT